MSRFHVNFHRRMICAVCICTFLFSFASLVTSYVNSLLLMAYMGQMDSHSTLALLNTIDFMPWSIFLFYRLFSYLSPDFAFYHWLFPSSSTHHCYQPSLYLSVSFSHNKHNPTEGIAATNKCAFSFTSHPVCSSITDRILHY